MSNSVDQRIVQMQFDNAQFQQGVSSTLKSLQNLDKSLELKNGVKGLQGIDKAVNSIDLSSLQSGIQGLNTQFSLLGQMGRDVISRISNGLVDMGQNVLRGATIQPLMDGLDEYSTKLGSVQTILTNTGWEDNGKGRTIEDVTKTLDELNSYADMTIYNFSEMTRNIGTFTAAGVGLEQSATAIKGIANLAASSGSTSEQASHAMYQLSQALSSGTLRLQDWVSVVNSGMGGKLFQDALKRTNEAMINTGRASISAQEAIDKEGSFRESLKDKWLDSNTLTETLENFTRFTSEMSKAEEKEQVDKLKGLGYTADQIAQIKKESIEAYDAATKVKEFSQLIDTTKEALGSGWATTWELIIGDLEQARALWTPISDFINGIINDVSDARNNVLRQWSKSGNKDIQSGRDALVEGIMAIGDALIALGQPISNALKNVFGGINADGLISISYAIRDLAIRFRDFVKESPVAQAAAKGLEIVFTVLFTAVKALGIILGGSFMVAITAIGIAFQTIGLIVDSIANAVVDFIITVANGFSDIIGVFRDFGQSLADQTGIEELKPVFAGVGRVIDSFVRALQGLTSWDNVSGQVKLLASRFRQLYDAIAPIVGENLKPVFDFLNTLKDNAIVAGGYAIGLVALGFMKLGEVLKPVADAILVFGFAVKNAFTKSFDFNAIGKDLNDFIETVKSAFQKFMDFGEIDNATLADLNNKIKKLLGSITQPISDFFKNLRSNLGGASPIDGIIDFLSNSFGKISDFLGKLRDSASIAFDGVFDVGGLFGFIKSIVDFFKPAEAEQAVENIGTVEKVADAVNEAKSSLGGIGDFFSGGFKSIGEGLADFANGIMDGVDAFVNRIDVDKLSKFISILSALAIDAGVVVTMYNFVKVMKALGEGIGGLGEAIESIGGILDGIEGNLKATKMRTTAEAIKTFAIAIAIIAGSIVVLTYIDHEKMYDAIPIMIGVVAVCALLPVLFGKLMALEGFNFAEMASLGIGIFQVALSVLIIAGAMILISNAADSINGVGIAAIIGIIGGIVALSLVASRIDMSGIETLGKSMRNISVSLLFMWAAIELLGHMDQGVAARGIAAIGAIMIFIGVMSKLASAGDGIGKSGSSFKGLGSTMLAIAIVIGTCAIAIGALGNMDMGALAQGVVAVGLIMVAIGVFMAAMTEISSLGNINGVVGPLLALTAAIAVFALAIGGLAVISSMGGDIVGATAALAVSLVVLAAACIAIGTSAKYLVEGAMGIAVIVIAVAALTVVLITLSAIDLDSIANGFLVFAVVLGAAAIAIAVFGAIGEAVGVGLVMVAAAFAIVAVGFIAVAAALLIGVTAMSMFTAIAPTFVPAFQQFAESLANLFATPDLVGTLIGFSVALALLGAASLIAGVGLGLLGLVVKGLPNIFTTLAIDVLTSINMMATGLSSMRDTIAQGVQGLLGGITDGIVGFLGTAVENGRQVADNIGNGLKNFDWATAAKDAIMTLGNGLITGLTALVVELPNIIGQIGSGIMEGIGDLLDEPLDAFGDWLSEATGVGYDRDALKEQAKQQVAAVGEGAQEGANESGEKVKESYEQIGDQAEEGTQNAEEKAKEAMGNFQNNLNEAVPSEGIDSSGIMDKLGLSPDIIAQGGDAIKEQLGGLGEMLPQSVIDGIANGGADFDILGSLQENMDPEQFSEFMSGMGAEGASGFTEGLESNLSTVEISNLVTGKADINQGSLNSKFSHAASSAASAFNNALNGGIKPNLSGKIATAVNQVRQPAKFQLAAQTDGSSVTKGFMVGSRGMSAAGQKAGNSAIKGVTSVKAYSAGYETGVNVGKGLVAGLEAKRQAIYNAAHANGVTSVQGQKDGAATASPSKIAIETGKYIGEGLVIGIQSMHDAVYNAGYESGDTAVSSMMSATSDFTGLFNDIDDNPTISPVLDLTEYEAGIRYMQGLNVGDQTVTAQWAGRAGAAPNAQSGYYNNQNNVNVTLDWKAGTTPNQMAQELAFALQTKNFMEA